MDRWFRLNPVSVRSVDSADGLGVQRRGTSRRSVYTIAALLSADGLDVCAPCTVRDISATGARLELEPAPKSTDRRTPKLPHQLKLHLCPQQTDLECRLVWQDGRHFGVAFVGDIPPVVRSLAV